MTMTGLTTEQVAARVAMLRRQHHDVRVIAIHTPGIWSGETELRVDGDVLPVVFCASALQVSEALMSLDEGGPPLIIITPLDDNQLSLDVLARMAGRQLQRIDRWQMVRDLFRARQIDPRLAPHGWIADALLQRVPEGGYPPAASGVLDLDSVWTQLLKQHLGLATGRPDAVALLQWSRLPQHLQRYEALSAEFRAGLRRRVQETAGPIGAAMLDAVDAGSGAWLLPIGLMCELLFAPDAWHDLGIAQARARLEPYLAGQTLSAEVASAWFQAAASTLAMLPEVAQRECLDRSERLLADLKAADYSALSSILPSGFNQRLTRFAETLQEALGGRAMLERLQDSLDDVRRHAQASAQADRVQRAHMALRLARYLAVKPPGTRPLSLSQLGTAYAQEGSYVDWARRYLSGGDEVEALAQAFAALASRVRAHREWQNREFAHLLADWHRTPMPVEGLLPIERAMSVVVAKLAAATPILLMVIDGMSYAVFRELCDDLKAQGWLELTDQPPHALPSLVSTIPSITETSRASLLAGKVLRGHGASEKQSFAAHPDLLAGSRVGQPPLLFHKGELVEAGATGVSAGVRAAIRDADRRTVAVVLNAVDDHLAKSDQLRLAWTVSQFQLLDALLYEARLANRAVVITSDHGHVLEDGTRRLAGGEEERWRATNDAPAEEEVVFADTRVEQAIGLERIVVPWSETVRYGQKKQGYHGGAAPQEVLVPIGVFTTPDRAIVGWEAVPEHEPVWWGRLETAVDEGPLDSSRPARRVSKSAAPQGSLFSGQELGGREGSGADWINHLLASPVFAAQRRVAGRRAPTDRDVERSLRALNQHHDRISQQTLAQALGQPDFHMRSMLMGLQRLLNVDGYQIVVADKDSGTIELNRQLLEKQFQLA